jgi:vanillate O-demethylase monooxygenase subunit
MLLMAYVQNAWYVASWSKDLPPGKAVGVKILGRRVVLWRNEEGSVQALEDRCVHRLAPLSHGRCEGANLRCMYHGLLFAPGGKVIAIPGQDMIPAKAHVRAYPVADRHGWIWVWMGDPALVDEALMPMVHSPDDPAWQLLTGELGYDADARLINDNLTDFSHLAFVHTASFGSNDKFVETPWKITPMPRGVRFERWGLGQPPVGQPDSTDRWDVWMVYEYSIPGVLHLNTYAFAAGAAERFGGSPPPVDATPDMTFYSAQAVTPVESGKARYLFSQGFKAPMPAEAVQSLMDVTLMAFAEDKEMIEAQQKVIDDDPICPIMPTAADKGVTLFNRLVERLCREEGQMADARGKSNRSDGVATPVPVA